MRKLLLLFTVASPDYNPASNAGGLPFLYILTKTCCVLPFWQAWADISLWFWIASLWCLVTLSICTSSLEKCLFRSSAHFLIRLLCGFCFCFFGVVWVFYILDINPLTDISLANIFSHSVSFLFVLLMVFFTVQKL